MSWSPRPQWRTIGCTALKNITSHQFTCWGCYTTISEFTNLDDVDCYQHEVRNQPSVVSGFVQDSFIEPLNCSHATVLLPQSHSWLIFILQFNMNKLYNIIKSYIKIKKILNSIAIQENLQSFVNHDSTCPLVAFRVFNIQPIRDIWHLRSSSWRRSAWATGRNASSSNNWVFLSIGLPRLCYLRSPSGVARCREVRHFVSSCDCRSVMHLGLASVATIRRASVKIKNETMQENAFKLKYFNDWPHNFLYQFRFRDCFKQILSLNFINFVSTD